ncbi:MAG: hypothetical protein RSB13_00550 [Aurantimicrobium sp.]
MTLVPDDGNESGIEWEVVAEEIAILLFGTDPDSLYEPLRVLPHSCERGWFESDKDAVLELFNRVRKASKGWSRVEPGLARSETHVLI